MALGPGLVTCQQNISVGLTAAAGLVHELMEARDERRLLNLAAVSAEPANNQRFGFTAIFPTRTELLFEVFSQRYGRGSILATANLPFDEWTKVFGWERLTETLLDRLTHRVHILEKNGESFGLKRGPENAASQATDGPNE